MEALLVTVFLVLIGVCWFCSKQKATGSNRPRSAERGDRVGGRLDQPVAGRAWGRLLEDMGNYDFYDDPHIDVENRNIGVRGSHRPPRDHVDESCVEGAHHGPGDKSV